MAAVAGCWRLAHAAVVARDGVASAHMSRTCPRVHSGGRAAEAGAAGEAIAYARSEPERIQWRQRRQHDQGDILAAAVFGLRPALGPLRVQLLSRYALLAMLRNLASMLDPCGARRPNLPCVCRTVAVLQVGWKHQAAVAELEEKRKAKSKQFYVAKKKLIALRAKAAAKVESA